MSLPRLLAGAQERTAFLAAHEATHGRLPARTRDELFEMVDAAGLRGRGGASFPTAVKLRSVAEQRGPRAVLVNGAEGEPMSAKDQVLMRLAPHLILDGALAAAIAVDAQEVVVAVHKGAVETGVAIRRAVQERVAGVKITVRDVPVAYLAGEETALIRFLDGGALLPTAAPPRPFERGLRGQPTLVQNPETFAHLALIARHGPTWFRELGTPAHPGSTLVTVAGAVRQPGVLEMACGTPLERVLAAAGGVTEPVRAVLVGGFHGVWIGADDIRRTTLDDESLALHGGSLAAGVIVALPGTACPMVELAKTVHWLAEQSAHQCGPCRNGLPAIVGVLDAMAVGRADATARERLQRWSGDLLGRGACRLPDGAVRFLNSGMRVFAAEVADHEQQGPCDACRRPMTLAVPRTSEWVAA